jgi:CRP/FNR family transcriptional regulator, dissimilatory nitrate respiration regulator
MELYILLEKCPLFVRLNSNTISELLESITYKTKDYKKDETIANSDEECRSMLIVIEGSVRGEMVDFNGKVIKIEDIESPRPLAPAFLFGANNRYPVSIIANENAKILSIPKDSVVKLLQISEIFLTNFLNLISNRAQFLSGKIRFLSFQTIKGKIADLLLQMHKTSGSLDLILPKSQNELAELFAVTRPSFARAIRELDNQGIIKTNGRNIQIIDKKGLIDLLR